MYKCANKLKKNILVFNYHKIFVNAYATGFFHLKYMVQMIFNIYVVVFCMQVHISNLHLMLPSFIWLGYICSLLSAFGWVAYWLVKFTIQIVVSFQILFESVRFLFGTLHLKPVSSLILSGTEQ